MAAIPSGSPIAPRPSIDLESRFEERDDLVEVVAAQGAERPGEGEVGGDGSCAGLLDQPGGPFELGESLVVGAAGGVLPGQHLDGGRDVGDEPELDMPSSADSPASAKAPAWSPRSSARP